jgi:hypothetical protein
LGFWNLIELLKVILFCFLGNEMNLRRGEKVETFSFHVHANERNV